MLQFVHKKILVSHYNFQTGNSKMRNLKQTTLAFALALTAFFSKPSSAQVASEHRIPLASYLAKQDIDASDLGNAVTVKVTENAQWSSGIIGNIRPAFFSIAPMGTGVERVARSLKVSFNPLFIQPMSFSTCDADNDCRSISATSAGKSLIFSHEGISWEVRSPNSPCHTYVCNFTIPAWSLEMRRQRGVNGWKSFPAVATILDQPNGVSIFDTRNGTEWTSFALKASSGPTSNLGKLLDASLNEGGLLNLKYERGALLLDFQTDRIFAIAETGAFFANEGLGAAQDSQATISWLELPFIQGRGKVIVANGELIIWEDRAVKWSARSHGIRKSSGTEVELPGTPSQGESNRSLLGSVIDILVTGESRITHWRFNPLNNSFTEISSEQIRSGEKYGLVSGVLGILQPEEPCVAAMLTLCNQGARALDMGGYVTASFLTGAEIKVSILIK